MFDEAIRVYDLFSQLSKDNVQGLMGNEPTKEEAEESDPVEVVDLKRNRGLVLQKLGKIYENEQYKAADIEMAITKYKQAIKMVNGFNNKQSIALVLQNLLT